MQIKKNHDMNSDVSPEIICAPATPEGYSALAVIRVSGAGSFDLIERIMSLKAGRLRGTRRKLGIISEKGEIVDEVIAFSWPAGRSYTGEEMVEITCHGVPEIIRKIMDILIRHGAGKADNGEFTRRAFMSGKLNAIQIMALASIWNEGRETGNISGRFSRECEEFIILIDKAKELLEGDIEFGESHLDSERKVILKEFSSLIEASETLVKRAGNIEVGQKVFLMGPFNSGKSTLFNILAGGKALVSDIPGTTRDGTRKNIEIRGRKVILCDTAGTGGEGLDLQASKAVLEEIQEFDKVVWMSQDGRKKPPEELSGKSPEILEVASKCDLNPVSRQTSGKHGEIRKLSSVTGEGISLIEEWISTSPGNMSLAGAVDRIVNHILKAEEFVTGDEFGIASEHLNEAEREIRSILGKGENLTLSVERALSSMCVGK
jgi:tRNA modification GTPase